MELGVNGNMGSELKGHLPPGPPTGRMGGASSSVKGAAHRAERGKPLTLLQSRRRSAVRWAGGEQGPSESDVTLDLTVPSKEDLWVNLLLTVLIKQHQVLVRLSLRLPQHFLE